MIYFVGRRKGLREKSLMEMSHHFSRACEWLSIPHYRACSYGLVKRLLCGGIGYKSNLCVDWSMFLFLIKKSPLTLVVLVVLPVEGFYLYLSVAFQSRKFKKFGPGC